MDWISNLCRVALLVCVGAEYRARTGKMLQNTPVALLTTVCRCRVKRSFESSTRPGFNTNFFFSFRAFIHLSPSFFRVPFLFNFICQFFHNFFAIFDNRSIWISRWWRSWTLFIHADYIWVLQTVIAAGEFC